jgi:hypothetical protein
MVDPAMMRIDYVILGLFIAVALILCGCISVAVIAKDSAFVAKHGVGNVSGKPATSETIHLVGARVGGGSDCRM